MSAGLQSASFDLESELTAFFLYTKATLDAGEQAES